MIKNAMILCAGLLTTFETAAQEQQKNDSTLNRTVVVENQYNPEVMDAFKVNVLPKIEEPQVAKRNIDYAMNAMPMLQWEAEPMVAFTDSQKQSKAYRGYVRAAYGNRNNTDVKGSYLWNLSAKDLLGVSASLYGMYGNIPLPESTNDWKSRFYRTDAALHYQHQFRNVTFLLGGDVASQTFNYMPSEAESRSSQQPTDHQRYTMGEGFMGVASHNKDQVIQFGLQSGFQRFNRKYNAHGLESGSENIVHTTGFIGTSIDEHQTVTIGLTMDNVFYDNTLKDYTLVQLNPYYKLQNENLSLHAGVHVDIQTANGSGFKVAPDVKLNYSFADTYVIYLHALGGSNLNDFRHLNQLTPYWAQTNQLATSHTLLDAKVGLKGSPINGFGFGLYGGYRITKNELFALPGAPETGENLIYTFLQQDKAKVGYGGASLSYAYRDWIDFTLEGTYYKWNTESKNEYLLALKPQFAVNFSARGKVFNGLHLTLNYNYEGRNDVATYGRAKAVNDLSVGAEYSLFNRMIVFARLDNLLNKEYIATNGYPVQGFYALGGVSFRF